MVCFSHKAMLVIYYSIWPNGMIVVVTITLPETNSQFSPEKQWLQGEISFHGQKAYDRG